MTCHETLKLLDGYVDGELDLAAALALEDHLESCARCKTVLARRRALRSALRRHAEPETAPESLRSRLEARFAKPASTPGVSWRWGLALSAPGIAALALAAWLGLSALDARRTATAHEMRVVYHIASSATASTALRNLANHLSSSPDVKVVVVAHNDGVDFLLRGARDESGQTLEPVVKRFRERGVEFRVCNNTLERRRIDPSQVIPEATLVPSGIAEIGRLQSEGYSYMRM